MPEMSALIVQEPSMLNDSANFCLDEIFQSSQKKKGDGLAKDIMSKQRGFTDEKTGRIENMKAILSRQDSQKVPTR